MKSLNLHCDYITFKALKKALKNIDEIAPHQVLEGQAKECLVVLLSVEKGDSVDMAKMVVADIIAHTSQINVKDVVLYPYAHLSKNLASPADAISIMDEIAAGLFDFVVVRAPFGYYKEFELKVKGHPLSELSREFKVEGNEVKEAQLTPQERELLWRKMSKIKMSAPLGLENKKSNVELGRELDLYMVSEVIGQGLPLFTPKGTAMKREIERFIVDEELRRGYEHTSTPIMAKSDLYKISGHWYHYKDGMFPLNVHGEDYALRPMTCPFHFSLYKRKPRTYKDLPKRYAEIASLFRNEQSGELRGLTRVRQFTLADAHIICTPEQVEEEFSRVVDLIKYIMKTFGIEVWYRFSKWDPKNKDGKYIDNPQAWERTQNSMKKILDKLKIDYVEADNEAAFYGPKLDLQYKDVYGKEDTLITVQIDFAATDKFNLQYTDADGTEKPVMVIHRSSTGATERVISYMLEKTQGNLPLWLAPLQVRVLTMTDDNVSYARKVSDELRNRGVRVELDDSHETISKKVRNAIMDKVFYVVTIGNKEQEKGVVAVRIRDGSVEELSLDDFVSKVKEEVASRKL